MIQARWKPYLTKGAIVAALLSMVVMSLPVEAQEAGQLTAAERMEQFKEEAAICSPDTIQSVGKQSGDLLFQPLLGERAADLAELEQVCRFLKKIADEGVEDPLPPEIREGFFHGFSITTRSGFHFDLSWSRGKLLMSSGEARLIVDNQNMLQMLGEMDMPSPSLSLDSEHVEIGQTTRVTGLDISYQADGEFDLLWIPYGRVQSGEPSEFVIHKVPTNFGRFDTTFIMPAFGKTKDGRYLPIPPGEGYMRYHNSGTGGSSADAVLKPASTPLISVNGIPAADPAMKALLINGRVHVPVRAIASLVKEPVVWHPESKSVLIRTKPESVLAAKRNGVQLWIDGKIADAAYQPILRNNLTYVPIRTVTAAFDLEVKWWEESRSVNIVIPAKAATSK